MVLLLVTVLFGVFGGAAILLALVTETPATARSDSGSEIEAIARRFYAAVNDAVRTGDLSLLDHVAVTNTDHMPDTAGTGCDVHCRVGALHRLAPDVRLQVDDVLVDGSRVAARLSIQGHDRPALLGLPLQGDLAPWGPVDFLRIDGGQVVEVLPAGALPSLVEPLGRTARESVPAAPYRIGLVRLTLEPRTAIPALSAEGPVILLVESGTLVVRVNQPSWVQSAGAAGDPGRDELPAGAITLSPGEWIALAANTDYSLRSIGNEAAVVLSAAALAGDGGPTNRWVRPRSLGEILFKPGEPDVVSQTSPPTPWPLGVRSELIAYGIIKTRPAELATLELTRVTLAPNAALPVHDTSAAELLAVDTGTAVVDLVAGDGAVRPKMAALLAKISPHGGSSAYRSVISPGGSAVLQPGASAGVRNVDDDSLVLLVLSLEPGSDAP
jgi:quercetin dioxygenase-like cupin family protein/predicted ester cyclase